MKLLKQYPWFLPTLIVLLAIVVRILPIWGGNFTFMYDHAKDALEIREMGVEYQPALIGAVTSIPGVYYGPLWYYLALPLNLILNFHPWASVLTVIGLSALGVWLAHKTWGPFAAFVIAVSGGLVSVQQSAWSPYMTPFVTLPLLAVLYAIAKAERPRPYLAYLVALLLSLTFHFQPAFGVVLVPITIAILLLWKVRWSWQTLLLSAVIFCVPFAPLVVFDLRHNFHQTREVLNFIATYRESAHVVQPNEPGLFRLVEIFRYVADAFSAGFLPYATFGFSMAGLFAAVDYFFAKRHKRSAQELRLVRRERILYLCFFVGAWLLYLVFPAKPYYFVGLYPVSAVLFARSIVGTQAKLILLISVCFLILSGLRVHASWNDYQYHAQQSATLWQPKVEAVAKVFELANGESFVSYHFVPEVYDYTYQYIYLYMSGRGKQLPTEFSYAPGEFTYIPQKHVAATAPQSTKVFLIVEKTDRMYVYQDWWKRVASDLKILESHTINSAITVYSAERQAL